MTTQAKQTTQHTIPAGELIRTCRFSPYRKGMGPRFTLRLFDANIPDGRGSWKLGYTLTRHEGGKSTLLFSGSDYGCSPLHAVDSDAAVEGIMSFLTLRKGDTDSDYFDGYTPEQTAFSEQHAETLSCEVSARFCDENGNVISRG